MVKKKGLFLIAGLFSTLVAIFAPSMAMADAAPTGSAITNIVMSVYKAPGSTAPQTGDNPLWIIIMAVAILAAMVSFGMYLKTRYVPKHATVSVKTMPIAIVAAIGISLAMITAGVGIANAKTDEPVVPNPVSDQIQVLTADDGSEFHYGDAPYSNVQYFTNTSQDYTLSLTKISLVSTGKVNSIGNWHCTCVTPAGQEVEVFNGGMGSYYEISDSYMLAPGESYTMTWSTDLTAKQLKELGDVTPAYIQYDYEMTPNEFVGVVDVYDFPEPEAQNTFKAAAKEIHPAYGITFYYDGKDHKTADNYVEVLPRNAADKEDWFYHTPENSNAAVAELASDYVVAAVVDSSVNYIPNLKSTAYMFQFPMLMYLEGVNNINMSNVKNAEWMFGSCSAIVLDFADAVAGSQEEYNMIIETYYTMNNLDVTRWDTHNLVNACGMFSMHNGEWSFTVQNSKSTQEVTIPYVPPEVYPPIVMNMDTDNVEDMSYMFYEYPATMSAPLVDTWNTSGVYDMESMFEDYANYFGHVEKGDNSTIPEYMPAPNMLGWDVSNVEYMDGMFYHYGGSLLLNANEANVDNDGITFDFSTWNTRNVESWYSMLEIPYLYQIKIGKGWDLTFKTAFGNMYTNWKDLSTGEVYTNSEYDMMPTQVNTTYQRHIGSPRVNNAPAAEETPAVQNAPAAEEVPPVIEAPAAEEAPAPVVEEPVT